MKVGIYCRVSGDSQKDNTSLKSQKELGVKFCNDKGYDYEIFSEVVSGKLKGNERKKFLELENKILSKEIEGIWFYDWDRMVREVDVMIYFRNLVEESGCKVFIGYEEKNIFEDSGFMEMGIRSVFSDYERRKIYRRMINGRNRKWREGKGLSNVGFGWRKNEDGYFVVDEEESKVVKDIYELYLRKDVKFFSDVEKRIITKYGKIVNGRRVNGGLVERVLGKEKYKGKIEVVSEESGEKFPFNIGRIIDDETFDKVLKKKNRMKSLRSVNMVENYLLKGKVVCGDCGSNMWIKGGGKVDKEGNVYRYYYCNDRERKKKYDKKFDKEVIEFNKRFNLKRKFDLSEYEKKYGKFKRCGSLKSNTISRNILEEMIWGGLYDFLLDSDDIKKEYKKRFEKKLGEKDRVYSKLGYYDKELKKLDVRKRKMMNLYLDEDISKEEKDDWIENEYNKRVVDYKDKIKGLERELPKYDNKKNLDGWIELMERDLSNEYYSKRFEDKRRIIEKYVDWVSVKYLDGSGESKVYSIRLGIMIGNKIKEVDINKKRIHNINNRLIYKVNPQSVGAEGFEPPTPWV